MSHTDMDSATPMNFQTFGACTWDPAHQRLRIDGREVPLDPRQATVFAQLAAGRGAPVAARRLQALDGGPADAKALWEVVGAINEHLAQGTGRCWVAHHPSEGFSLMVDGAAASRPPMAFAGAGPMVGRDEAVARIDAQLAQHRFVTIVGAGGLGKTTVARRVASEFAARQGIDLFVVDLSRLAEGRLVAPAVGMAMGFAPTGGDPLASLAAFVRDKKMLVLLDSCEHFTEGAARVAEALLRASPELFVLATSREPLLAAGERLHRLPELETPRPGERMSDSPGRRYSAVELFVQRVTQHDPAFRPSEDDLDRVADICRRLDGLPLAIEIAAARATELGLADLSRQLDERLLFAEGAMPQAPARHQTLAAMMDWTHGQLGAAERVALRQLSVFRGRFDLDAAEAVVAGSGVHAREVSGAVIDLVERSLLSRTAQGDFRLLDTTRVYASTKLLEGERSALAVRHARYLLGLLQRAEADWLTQDGRVWLDTYGEWVDDIRQALDACFGPHGDEALGVQLAFASFELGRQMSLDVEFRHHMQRALPVLERRVPRDYLTEITLKAYLGSMGQLIDREGSPQHRSLEQMLEQEGARISARVQIVAVGSINHAALMAADFATATHWAERAIVAARASGDAVAFSIAERMNAQTLHFMGRHAEAEALALSVLASRRKIPLTYIPSPVEPRVSMRLLLARLHWMQGKPASAARWADECMQHAGSDTAISQCQALAMCALPLALWNRELDKAVGLAARLRQVAERHSLGYWLYWAERIELVLALEQGEAGVLPDARLFKAGTSEANLRDHLCTFDPRLLGADVVARIDEKRVGWCGPEVLRARAVAAMEGADGGAASAEGLLADSIALARAQGALAWELRASVTLARWLGANTRGGEGRVQLAATLARFEEGAESADLREARALLAALANVR